MARGLTTQRLCMVASVFMALVLGLLQLRFSSMNDLSAHVKDLDAITVGDLLPSRLVASFLLPSSSATADGASVAATNTATASDVTPPPTRVIVVRAATAKQQKDLRLDRLFAHVSNKTQVRNGVPVLRPVSRKCRAMNAHQRLMQNNSSMSSSSSSSSWQETSSVEFIGCCGLGHRLARMAAAAHVAVQLETALYGDWECCDKTDVFDELFGHEPMILGNYTLRQAHHYPNAIKDYNPQIAQLEVTPASTARTNRMAAAIANMIRPHHLQFTYEVPGFVRKPQCPCRPEKIRSDYQFFSALRHRYKRKQEVNDFVAQHFHNRTSVGMHIRAGNGETGDFENKKRFIPNEAQFVLNVVQLIQHLIRNVNAVNRPPILFLATDTEHFIETFRKALSSPPNSTFWSNLAKQINNNNNNNSTTVHEDDVISFPHFQVIPVVHLSQIRPPKGKGVLFGEFNRVASKGETCMTGWHGALQDQMILSHADIVLAPKVSSFTQTLPLSLTVGRQHYDSRSRDSSHLPKELVERPFCEGDSIANVQCYNSVGDWCCRTSAGKPTFLDIHHEWYEWLT